MKRSQINQILAETVMFLDEVQFYLPEWAKWTLDDWQRNKNSCDEIFACEMGWDISEGAHDFAQSGMVLFTIRNGRNEANMSRIQPDKTEKSYCEKIIVMQPGQICPYHYHSQKMEDIINRSQSDLLFHIYKEAESGAFTIQIDGIRRTIQPNDDLLLHSGQSLTLPPFYTHSFRPLIDKMLIGEVSTVNDDHCDNIFIDENVLRFPKIEEDEEILYPLIGDYRKFGLYP